MSTPAARYAVAPPLRREWGLISSVLMPTAFNSLTNKLMNNVLLEVGLLVAPKLKSGSDGGAGCVSNRLFIALTGHTGESGIA